MSVDNYRKLAARLQDKTIDSTTFIAMNYAMTVLIAEHEAQLLLDAGADVNEVYAKLPMLKGRDLEDIGYVRFTCHVEKKEDRFVNNISQTFFTDSNETPLERASEIFHLGIVLRLAKTWVNHSLGLSDRHEVVSVKPDYTFEVAVTKLQIAEYALAYYPWMDLA